MGGSHDVKVKVQAKGTNERINKVMKEEMNMLSAVKRIKAIVWGYALCSMHSLWSASVYK